MVGLQALDRIQRVHESGYLHRNIRPENFVIGLDKNSFLIYMIDFSKCMKFKNKKGVHIPYQQVNRNETNSFSKLGQP